jgi:metal-responsive CopG/Arc/MetJ family transcriptional regulator
MKGQKYMLGVTVEPKLVKEIDELRGEIPRSRVVERALNQFIERWKAKENVGIAITSIPSSEIQR